MDVTINAQKELWVYMTFYFYEKCIFNVLTAKDRYIGRNASEHCLFPYSNEGKSKHGRSREACQIHKR